MKLCKVPKWKNSSMKLLYKCSLLSVLQGFFGFICSRFHSIMYSSEVAPRSTELKKQLKKRYQVSDLGSSKLLVIPEKIGEETLRNHCQLLELGLAELCFYFHIHWYNFGMALACMAGNILQKPSGNFRQSEQTILSLSSPLGLWHSTGIL